MSAVEILNQMKRLASKYQTPFGIAIWGFTAPGQAKEILVDSEGRLQIGGTVTTEVPNLDVPLSTRASESTLSGIKAKTDNLDVLLSSRASETTLSGIKSQTDKLTFDASNRLKTQLDSIPNPPNLDVALSTRASESTLSGILSNHALRRFWVHSPVFVERWEWLASADAQARKRLFYNRYCGRTGSVWADEYAELNPDSWNMPLYSLNANTIHPSPFKNAIHLRNSKDGTTPTEVYFAPKITLKPPCILVFDAYIPAINNTNFPEGAYVTFGFEVNSGGYKGFIAEWRIINEGAGVVSTLRGGGVVDGSITHIVSSNFAGSVPTGVWKNFILVLLPNRLILLCEGSELASLALPFDVASAVTPYFANEFLAGIGTPIVSNVYVGQFQAYEGIGLKTVRKVIDAASISAGGYVESDVLVLPKECAVQISQTYGSTATAGVSVYILACNRDGTIIDSENTTDAFTYFEPSFTAGATRVKTVNLDMLPKYCRIRVRNKDSANAQGACKVYVHEVY